MVPGLRSSACTSASGHTVCTSHRLDGSLPSRTITSTPPTGPSRGTSAAGAMPWPKRVIAFSASSVRSANAWAQWLEPMAGEELACPDERAFLRAGTSADGHSRAFSDEHSVEHALQRTESCACAEAYGCSHGRPVRGAFQHAELRSHELALACARAGAEGGR